MFSLFTASKVSLNTIHLLLLVWLLKPAFHNEIQRFTPHYLWKSVWGETSLFFVLKCKLPEGPVESNLIYPKPLFNFAPCCHSLSLLRIYTKYFLFYTKILSCVRLKADAAFPGHLFCTDLSPFCAISLQNLWNLLWEFSRYYHSYAPHLLILPWVALAFDKGMFLLLFRKRSILFSD